MIFFNKEDKWLYEALMERGEFKRAELVKERVKALYAAWLSLIVSLIALGHSIIDSLKSAGIL